VEFASGRRVRGSPVDQTRTIRHDLTTEVWHADPIESDVGPA
jgi:hypothetical protein